MTKEEFMKSKEYTEMKCKIKNRRKGSTFTIPYYEMTEGQKNGMDILMTDCEKEGLLTCISIGLDVHGNISDKTFKRV